MVKPGLPRAVLALCTRKSWGSRIETPNVCTLHRLRERHAGTLWSQSHRGHPAISISRRIYLDLLGCTAMYCVHPYHRSHPVPSHIGRNWILDGLGSIPDGRMGDDSMITLVPDSKHCRRYPPCPRPMMSWPWCLHHGRGWRTTSRLTGVFQYQPPQGMPLDVGNHQ